MQAACASPVIHPYRGRLAVLVKPNGLFGKAYLTAIAPFRHRLVYPAMLRQIRDAWQPVR